MRTEQVECVVFKRYRRKIKYLLLKRIPRKGHFWQPPCGGVEKGDKTLQDAVFRELYEEAGISQASIKQVIDPVHTFKITTDYLTGESANTITEYVFGVEVYPKTKVTLDKNIYVEHEAKKWVTFKQALNMLKWEDNKIGLRKLHEHLSNK